MALITVNPVNPSNPLNPFAPKPLPAQVPPPGWGAGIGAAIGGAVAGVGQAVGGGAPVDLSFLNQGGGGGYDDGGGGAYAAQAAAEQAAWDAQVQQQYDAAKTAIGSYNADLLKKLADLRGQQGAGADATSAALRGLASSSRQGLTSAIDPVLADVRAQGFSTAPVDAAYALDQQRMGDMGNRYDAYMRMLQQVQDRSMSDREALANQMNAAALYQLEQNRLAAVQGGSGGGGGGGRGGGGGGGGSSSDILSAGDASIAADLAATPRLDFNASKVRTPVMGDKRMDRYLTAMVHGDKKLGLGRHLSGGMAHATEIGNLYVQKYAARFAQKGTAGGAKVTDAERKKINAFRGAVQKTVNSANKVADKRASGIQKKRKAQAKATGRGLV